MPERRFEDFLHAAERGDVDGIRSSLDSHPDFIHQRDDIGATALHYAAFAGHNDAVRLLVERGAAINALDTKFGGTPAGWAIEYMREMGAFLGIELRDFAYAIEQGDARWVARLLKRFPKLRDASAPDGTPFRILAERSSPEIRKLFS